VKSFALLPAILFACSCVLPNCALAGSATWNLSPTTGDWNTASNWQPASVPNGPTDIATFATSNKVAVSVSAKIEVNEIVFNPGASAYTITSSSPGLLTLSGRGITNNSGVTQGFIAQDCSACTGGALARLTFTNAATGGSGTAFTALGAAGEYEAGGEISFAADSSAGSASFEIFAGRYDRAYEGEVAFFDNSTADHGTFLVHSGPGYEGALNFFDNSTAGDAIVTNAGGFVYFWEASDAGNSVIANDGYLVLRDGASAGTAIIDSNTVGSASYYFGSVNFWGGTAANSTITNEGGTFAGAFGSQTDFSGGSTGGDALLIAEGGINGGTGGSVTFAIKEGLAASAGNATIIANPGSNGGTGGLIQFGSTSDGGTARIQVFGDGSLDIAPTNALGVTIGSLEGDGLVLLGSKVLTIGSNNLTTTFSGIIQDSGQLVKIGTGNLTLTSGNTYDGGTSLEAGILLANNRRGSATGTGPVQVNAGTFGGGGTVSGPVTIGTGRGAGSILAPGERGVTPGTFTIRRGLTLKADATFFVLVDSSKPAADRVRAKGVTIRGAQIQFSDRAATTLPPGTTLIIVDNTSPKPINGTFSNLADGATVTVGSNTLQADYEGGDGNDLALTVVQ